MAQSDTSATTGIVAGFFEDQAAAERALHALHDAGFTSAHLGTAHPGVAETAVASSPASAQDASLPNTANTVGEKTEEVWDKVKGLFGGRGTDESESTGHRPDHESAIARTTNPVQPQDGLTLNEDLSHFVTNETGGSTLGAVVTVKAPGRESEAEAILRNLGADLGDTPTA